MPLSKPVTRWQKNRQYGVKTKSPAKKYRAVFILFVFFLFSAYALAAAFSASTIVLPISAGDFTT